MNIAAFLHDPTWMKVRAAAAICAAGVVGIAALRYRITLERRRASVVKQVAAAYAKFPAHLVPRRRHTLRNVLVSAFCCAASILSGLFAARGYTILSNWDEGARRDAIGDHVGALICYKKALRVDSGLRPTHYLVGKSLMESGRISSAIAELEMAARGEHSDTEAAATLGDAYQLAGRPADAATAYRMAAAISPGKADLQIGIASCMESLHRPDEAYHAYEKAIQIDPSYTPAHLKIGSLLISSGNRDEGLSHLKYAASLSPRSMMAHDMLATAYARCEENDLAVAEHKRAIALDPGRVLPQYDFGVTLEHMGALERALAVFRGCAKLDVRSGADRVLISKSADEARRIELMLKDRAQ